MEGADNEQKKKDKAYMEKYKLKEDQLAELKESFTLFDKNGDGVITPVELGTVLRALGQNPTVAEEQEMIDEVDLDENGTCSFDEFLRVTTKKGLKSEPEMLEDLQEAMKFFDKNDNGYIEAKELKQALKTLGEPVDDDDISEMIKMADVDKNGKIDYMEFAKVLMLK